MKLYIRLDDACERMNIENWNRIEILFDKYNIKPLVGIIPHCEDSFMNEYEEDKLFWNKVGKWVEKGWSIALHGFNHVFVTKEGGLNPVNKRSEFAGVPLLEQKKKIKDGVNIFRSHGFEPKIFFAPAHTFDMNTLIALREESEIRIISDTIANKTYSRWGFTFVPQQSGRVRSLPFNTITFCYHPNTMKNDDFFTLEEFIKVHKFLSFPSEMDSRNLGFFDFCLRGLYFFYRQFIEI